MLEWDNGTSSALSIPAFLETITVAGRDVLPSGASSDRVYVLSLPTCGAGKVVFGGNILLRIDVPDQEVYTDVASHRLRFSFGWSGMRLFSMGRIPHQWYVASMERKKTQTYAN